MCNCSRVQLYVATVQKFLPPFLARPSHGRLILYLRHEHTYMSLLKRSKEKISTTKSKHDKQRLPISDRPSSFLPETTRRQVRSKSQPGCPLFITSHRGIILYPTYLVAKRPGSCFLPFHQELLLDITFTFVVVGY